ncbi:hypothetical protein [Actinomadura rudentiformis]|uniref:Cyanovirin-N domain-containing protein n=1 Tax=Actinomadura rudentiformis TaxID=359158 RepID=A0A6H9Z127_9ACTN|nr:hypothetical protein [Actinomadura rudentiformis]KAB2347764.1 hypothetical protein F8566_17835 [Actinomadura rudentiformis]
MTIVRKCLAIAGLAVAITGAAQGSAFGAAAAGTVTSPSGNATCTITESTVVRNQAFNVKCSGTTVPKEYIAVQLTCNNGAFYSDNFGTLNNSTRSKEYVTCGRQGFKDFEVLFRYNNGNG